MSIHSLRSFAHFSAICFLVTFPVVVWSQPRPLVQPAELKGDIRQVHDPATIIKEGENYYLFSTRAGIAIRCSKDVINWRLCGDVFAHLPEWAVKDVVGLRGLWAPDISSLMANTISTIQHLPSTAIVPASVSLRTKHLIRQVTNTVDRPESNQLERF